MPTLFPTLAPASATPILTATPFAYERNPRALLIEADIFGGDTHTPRDMHVPTWRLYGDGLVVFAGESAPLSSGLDAAVRVGHLADSEIQSLFAYLDQSGFFSLNEAYAPRPVPADAPTATISVYANKVKTVRVLAPEAETTPRGFADALKRITWTIPADAQTVAPTDAYLEALDAGPASSLGAKDNLTDWSVSGIRLADALDGVTISGAAFAQVSALLASKLPLPLFREGDHVYRVRFAPNVPRAVHLSDWVGVILDAPREFDGRVFEIVGYFRGWNLFGEVSGNPPVTRSDWVIADDSGAVYVTGAPPPGLDPSSRADAWSVVHLTAKVVYVRLGVSHLEARRVEVLSRSALAPTPTSAVSSTATITATRAVSPTIVGTTSATPLAPTRTVTAMASTTPTRTVTATVAP